MLEGIGLLPAHGLVLELDGDGKVVRSLHDVGGQVTAATSHIKEIDGVLYIGSYSAPYLVSVKL